MHVPCLAVLVLLSGTAVTAQPVAAAPTRETVALSEGGEKGVHEVSMGPKLLTSLLFGTPLRVAEVEVEERERFSRVTQLEDALLLVPSPSLAAGRRLRLRVWFVKGTVPASVDFFLVMDPARTESHQVNVELRRPPEEHCPEVEVERQKTQQCQTELRQVRQQSRELTGLLSTGLMDETGVTVRELWRQELTQRAGDPIRVDSVWTYRAARRVAVELRVANRSSKPWTVEGAELAGEGGARLKVLRVWPGESLAPGATRQRVLVEVEAARAEAQGRFTLSLWQDGEPESAVVDGVAFP